MSNTSNNVEEDDEVDNENSSTTSLLGTDIEEVDKQLYITRFFPLDKKCLPF